MSTAKQLVSAATKMIGVKRLGIELTDEELADGTEVLRDLLLEWEANKINIPAVLPEAPEDELNELDWTTGYIKLALAMRYCLYFTIEPTQNLAIQHKLAKKAVYTRITEMGAMIKSPTVPMGEGNSFYGNRDRKYYTADDQEYKDSIATGNGDIIIDDEGETVIRSGNILKGGQ